jgi:flavodoxin
MKCAVVYYSYDGHAAKAAKAIQKQLSCDALHLELQGEKHRKGFMKYVMYILGKLYTKPATLKPYTFHPHLYDLVIIGVPIWAEKPAVPLQLFLKQTDLSGKKIAIYCTSMSAREVYADRCKELVTRGTLLSVLNLSEKELDSDKLSQWVTKL